MAAVNFTGKWKEGETVNKEEFCLACGLSPEMSKQFGAMKVVLDIVHEGDNFHSKEMTQDGTMIMDEKMTVGVPYCPDVPEGVPKMEFTTSWEEGGKVLMSKATDPANKMMNTYQITDKGELLVTSVKDDVTFTGHYTKE